MDKGKRFVFDSRGLTNITVFGINNLDGENPAGGYAACSYPTSAAVTKILINPDHPVHFAIRWQDGPIDRDAGEKANGALIEDVLEVCARRLAFYQESKYACSENQVAYDAVREAIDVLLIRRGDRKERDVLGKHEVQGYARSA